MDIIKELEQRAERESNKHKARLRQNYGYARFLGFTPAQAKIMSGWSRSHIDRMPLPNKKEPKN